MFEYTGKLSEFPMTLPQLIITTPLSKLVYVISSSLDKYEMGRHNCLKNISFFHTFILNYLFSHINFVSFQFTTSFGFKSSSGDNRVTHDTQ